MTANINKVSSYLSKRNCQSAEKAARFKEWRLSAYLSLGELAAVMVVVCGLQRARRVGGFDQDGTAALKNKDKGQRAAANTLAADDKEM